MVGGTNTEHCLPDSDPLPPAPPAPKLVGRDKEMKVITDWLVADRHVAAVGAGGMGKSSLALAAMNDRRIIEKFPRRFFFRLDKAESGAAVISELHR